MQSTKSSPVVISSKQLIDDFLTKIAYLPPILEDDLWSREWDLEYNKFTLALAEMDSFEEFDAFHTYVWIKMCGSVMGNPTKHHVIWENRPLWMAEYVPRLEWDIRDQNK